MSQEIPQSTSISVRIGPFVDETDGFTAEEGLTITQPDIRLSKNGGAFAQKSSAQTLAHDENGFYGLDLSNTDTNTLGRLKVHVHESGARPVTHDFEVLAAQVWNSKYSTDKLQVDVVEISGDATAADNLETVFDGVEGLSIGYAGPRGFGVYFDDTAGNTNTVSGVDGTEANPVSGEAAARTIAGAMGFRRIYVVNDSTITFAASYDGWEIIGIGDMASNTAALGGQDMGNSCIHDMLVSGAQGGSGRMMIVGGFINGVTSFEAVVVGSGIMGGITLRSGAGNDSYFDQCYSTVPGNSTPELTFAANADCSFRHYSGGLQINSMAAGSTMSYETDGQMIIDATCTGGALTIRGNCTITDNASGAVTVTDVARLDADHIADHVLDEARSGHTIQGSVGESFSTIVSGAAIAGTLSTTQMTTDLSETQDDQYNGGTLVFLTGDNVKVRTPISDYDGTTKILTYTAIPVAPSATDEFIIV